MRRVTGLLGVLALSLLAGCTDGDAPAADDIRNPTTSSPTTASSSPATSASSPSGSPSQPVRVSFDRNAAMDTVRRLSEDIGTREATSPGFARAADLVAAAFEEAGYDARRDTFRVPRGVSWGVPVPVGRSLNVVATPPGFRPGRPHIIVGAHLDTVPQSPGAVDNASGVAVVLELARLASAEPPDLPVVLIAFGAEEPRGPGDDLHHFGSRHYVRTMPAGQRRALVAMVSLDRMGAGRTVRVCTGGLSPLRVQRDLIAAAGRLDIPAQRCENRTSDHWPFEKAGQAVARVGGNSYAAYHSARDRFAVVRPVQVARVGRLMWEWLRTGGGASP